METDYILITNFLQFKQIGPLFLHGKFKVNQVYSSKNIIDETKKCLTLTQATLKDFLTGVILYKFKFYCLKKANTLFPNFNCFQILNVLTA